MKLVLCYKSIFFAYITSIPMLDRFWIWNLEISAVLPVNFVTDITSIPMLLRFRIWNLETGTVLQINFVCLHYFYQYAGGILDMKPRNYCCATREFCLLTLNGPYVAYIVNI